MRAKDHRDSDNGPVDSRFRLWSAPSSLAVAVVSGIGVLTSVFLAANRNLTGWHYLAAIVLAAVALLLLVEAYNRAQAKVSWIAIGAIGGVATCASLVFVVIPANHHSAATGEQVRASGPSSVSVTGNDGLKFSSRLIPRELPKLAFYDQISLPKANEGWSQLRRRGGIDVGSADLRLLLEDRSPEPISVLSVRVEVLESRPRPRGTLAYEFSQGGEGIEQLAAVIHQVHPGTIARVYPRSAAMLDPSKREKSTPYFKTAYILLRPGEVDPVSLTVIAETSRLVRFRLIAEGRSAGHTFVRRSPALQPRREDVWAQRRKVRSDLRLRAVPWSVHRHPSKPLVRQSLRLLERRQAVPERCGCAARGSTERPHRLPAGTISPQPRASAGRAGRNHRRDHCGSQTDRRADERRRASADPSAGRLESLRGSVAGPRLLDRQLG